MRKPPPVEISLLVGEMIYQMRSALDHLIFDLMRRNPHVSSIDPEWEENCQFPLRTRPPKGRTPPLKRSDFSRDLPGIADAPFAFIESVQPYYRVGTVNNALRFLRCLSNIDKHRRLNLIRTRIRQHESIRYPHGLSSRGYSTLDRGAEIDPAPAVPPLSRAINGKPEKPIYVSRRHRALVAFDEGRDLGEATDVPVDLLLQIILGQINSVILPQFEKFKKA